MDAQEQADLISAALRQVDQDLADLGRVSQGTRDNLRDAQIGLVGYSAAVRKSASELAKFGSSLTKATYEGARGAAAFNNALDGMANSAEAAGIVLTGLIPGGAAVKAVIFAVTKGLGFLFKAVVETTKAANIQGDALFKAMQDLSKSGAIASGGTTKLGQDLSKLGLSFTELDGFVALINENSRDLALLGGSAFQGANALIEIADASEQYRKQMQLIGLNATEQNEAIMGYVKIQTRLGNAARMQEQGYIATAAAANKYIMEQDALTKLTGISRKEQEKSLEKAMSQARFAATLDKLTAEGKGDEAKLLQKRYQEYAVLGADAQEGFADLASGFIKQGSNSSKLFMSSQGDALRDINEIKAGRLKDETDANKSFQTSINAIGATAKNMRGLTQAVGDDSGVFLKYSEARLAAMKEEDPEAYAKRVEEIKEQQASKDKRAAGQADTIVKQQSATILAQKTVDFAVNAAAKATNLLATGAEKAAEAAFKAADALDTLAGGKTEPGTQASKDKQPGTQASKDKQPDKPVEDNYWKSQRSPPVAPKPVAPVAPVAPSNESIKSQQEHTTAIEKNKTAIENRKKVNADAAATLEQRQAANRAAEQATTDVREAAKKARETKIKDEFQARVQAKQSANIPATAVPAAPTAAPTAAAPTAAAAAAPTPSGAVAAPSKITGMVAKENAAMTTGRFDQKFVTTPGAAAAAPAPVAKAQPDDFTKSPMAKLIAQGESGAAEYNAFNRGTERATNASGKAYDKPLNKLDIKEIDLSKMTIDQYFERNKLGVNDPMRLGAVGKYQIIATTMQYALEELKKQGIDIDTKTTTLDEKTQDLIFNKVLIGSKRPDIDTYIKGIDRKGIPPAKALDKALLSLAQEFESFGVPYPAGEAKVRGGSFYGQGKTAPITPEQATVALNATRDEYMRRPSAADGGMFKGPRSGYAATLHGMEAVIPLKNGSVPVSLSMKDITAAGGNNQLPNLVEEIRNNLTELKTQNNSGTATSELQTVVQDFKTVILTAVATMSAKGNQSDFRNIEYMLAEMVRGQQASVDVQQKMLQVARN